MAKYTSEEIVNLVMEKKVPLLVRHGIIAIWEGTYRYIKRTKGGNLWRTQIRFKVNSRSVSKNKQGFIDAFNIIMASFTEYGFLSKASQKIALTSKGQMQNRLHLREVDSRRRTILFETIFNRLFSREITAYNLNKQQENQI